MSRTLKLPSLLAALFCLAACILVPVTACADSLITVTENTTGPWTVTVTNSGVLHASHTLDVSCDNSETCTLILNRTTSWGFQSTGNSYAFYDDAALTQLSDTIEETASFTPGTHIINSLTDVINSGSLANNAFCFTQSPALAQCVNLQEAPSQTFLFATFFSIQNHAILDNVNITFSSPEEPTSETPEPSAFVLLLSGAAGLPLVLRRRATS